MFFYTIPANKCIHVEISILVCPHIIMFKKKSIFSACPLFFTLNNLDFSKLKRMKVTSTAVVALKQNYPSNWEASLVFFPSHWERDRVSSPEARVPP